jgi:hypothetical protein
MSLASDLTNHLEASNFSTTVGVSLGTCGLRFRRMPEAPFGVEVSGFGWRRPDADTCRVITSALRSHLLLVLRGQRSPSEAELDDFLRGLGRLVLETEDGR